MNIVKYFKQGKPVVEEIENTKDINNIIRVIPENHKIFNIDCLEYVCLCKDNIKHLSVGDMIIIHKGDSTFWHEITFNNALNCLCYFRDIPIENLAKGIYDHVLVRNDFFIPEYATR